MTNPKTHRIALLFNGNKTFDREVITGIADSLSSTRLQWDLFLEEDFRLRLAGIEKWQGDGIIADFDDPLVAEAMSAIGTPLVAVGGSYASPEDYPAGVPYVATDNAKLVELAHGHLIESGLEHFALFSLPEADENRWAQEREKAFTALMRRSLAEPAIFRGQCTRASTWYETVREQIDWLHSLPKPIGIIAVTDARARQLLQACTLAGIAVPEQVALIGIDNDPLARILTRIPMSSVIQGAQEIGRTAAHLLDRMLHGASLTATRILIPPIGINVLASSRHKPAKHPHVMRAVYFIRQYACRGIRTEQVADHVGISRSSLEAHFRQELGHSVHEEILSTKLNAATAMLEKENISLAEIALKCGFTSSQYMHLVFKRELGCSPRGYQERIAKARSSTDTVLEQFSTQRRNEDVRTAAFGGAGNASVQLV
jgi:LacI family transcriptional regulator